MASAGHNSKPIAAAAKLKNRFPATLDETCGLLPVVLKPQRVGNWPPVARYVQSFVHGVPVGRVVRFVEFEAEVDAEVVKSPSKSGKPRAGRIEKGSVPV